MNCEIEFKLRLADAAAADRLVAVALSRRDAELSTAHQKNHFFDTSEGDLQRARLAVRLRESGDKVLLTLKGEGVDAQGAAPSSRPEEEAEVLPSAAGRVLAGDADPMALVRATLPAQSRLRVQVEEAIGSRALQCVGSFSNERRRVGPLVIGAEAATLEVDRTEFPGGRVDHEVELETPADVVEEAREVLAVLLREAGIAWSPSSSKAARFFAILAAEKENGDRPVTP